MSRKQHVHLLGIGGTGMTALAGLLHETGCRVTGSDKALYPPTSTLLEQMGLEVHRGFSPENLDPQPDRVIVGNAISRGNPELEEVLRRDLDYTSMPRVLNRMFLRGRHSISVMGTHGKTTTTSMLAWILQDAECRPSYLIGGLPQNFERPYQVGDGPAFVIEGDEYDSAFFDKGPKFMHYRPDTAILGTVEFDHADIYRDLEEVKKVFRRVKHLVPPQGLLIRHEDCEVTREVTDGAFSRVSGFGFERGEWRAVEFSESEAGSTFKILRNDVLFADVELGVGGRHNALNALAATVAAVEQGVSTERIVRALAGFRGVRRRLEISGEVAGVTVIDDFAHHPTAIEATLSSLRLRYPGRKLWAVLEPRSWSLRRNVFQGRLPDALRGADEAVIAAVFRPDLIPETERLDPDRLVADLSASGCPARFLADADSIVAHLAAAVSTGDVVAVMSNGGFDGFNHKLLDALRLKGRAVGQHGGV